MDDKHVINCNDVPEIDMTRQDGGLEHKAGVYTYQIRRSCRTDGDYTYNHAPMLTAFNNRLVLSYISDKRDEHVHLMKSCIQHLKTAVYGIRKRYFFHIC